MKLTRTQLVGLLAILVFGGGMILRMTQPSEREIIERRIASLPRIEAPSPAFPTLEIPSATQRPNLAQSGDAAGRAGPRYPGEPDFLNLGSQAARDDMYCAGVISAEFDARPDQHPDDMSKQIAALSALDEAGSAKLFAEKAATEETRAGFTLAYAARAKADRALNALAISFDACMQRAAALATPN